MDMDLAYKKLVWIKQECGGNKMDEPSASGPAKNSFDYHKKQMHLLLLEAKNALIIGADDAVSLSGRKRKAETSHMLRVKMQQATELVNVMQLLHEQELSKCQKNPKATGEMVEKQSQCLELCKAHIQECSHHMTQLDENKFNAAVPSSSYGRIYGKPMDLTAFQITHSELPDIDMERDFDVIHNTQQDIQNDIIELYSGVRGLKEIALDIGRNVDQQQESIVALEGKAQKTEQKMENLNVKLKRTLQRVMKGDKFIVNIVLVLALLGLLYFLSGFIAEFDPNNPYVEFASLVCAHTSLAASFFANRSFGMSSESVPKCFVVAVAGGTRAGKKILCDRIKGEISAQVAPPNSVFVLHAENFYNQLSETDAAACAMGQYNFDTPNAYNFQALADCLRKFKDDSVQEVAIPVFDMETHVSKPEAKIVPKPRILLVEGIFVLYEKNVRDLIDMKVFVDVASDVRLASRVMKENPTGNPEKLEQLLVHYMRFVKPGYEEFIFPTKKYADIIIPRGVDNRIGIDLIIQHIIGILEGQHDGIPHYPVDKSSLLFVE